MKLADNTSLAGLLLGDKPSIAPGTARALCKRLRARRPAARMAAMKP